MPNLDPEFLVHVFMYYIVFLFSTTCHEAAHGLAAKLGGDNTAELGGQVSLNPIPHIRRSPFGMVVFPLLSAFFLNGMIGFASAPYDPNWARRHPHRAGLMALAGPATNFSLMILGALGLRLGASLHWIHSFRDPAAQLFFALFSLNLLLGVFNLIPAPPLDGSSAIMLFMSEDRARGYLDWIHTGTYAMPGILVSLVIFRYIFPPVEKFIQSLLL
ncbi:MAG TPA: site-2 protease family protein [Verrucomicrobiae bacterium]|nr:site-2 protease family protein [Verrucomicrobiae bacterium]